MAIKAKKPIDFYSLLSVALLVLFNACTTVKHNGYKFSMNSVRLSIITLWNRWCSGKIGIRKYLRNHYYLRKFSTTVRQKKGTMVSLTLTLISLSYQSKEAEKMHYPHKGIIFFL